MRYIHALRLLLLLISIAAATAQPGGRGGSKVYPTRLYPGDNVITVRNPAGIERIQIDRSARTTVTMPKITGCPKEVEIRIALQGAVGQENLNMIVFDCSGSISSESLVSEDWNIRHERTGPVELNSDTCLQCRIESSSVKVVDSIVTEGEHLRVVMPPKEGGEWVARGNSFRYQICYSATAVESRNEMVRLYIRRDEPNGGLTNYVIEKPFTVTGVLPPPPPPPKKISRKDSIAMTLPPLVDPTTFRNIIMPTAEPVGKGKTFLASYEVVGLLAGYGVTEKLTVMGGGAFVPEFVSKLVVGTIGARYEIFSEGDLKGAAGLQFGYTSIPESQISVTAPYAVLSYGDRENRLSLAVGYAWKRHVTPFETFNRNAAVLALGGDVTVARGWKIAAETYAIESSGLAPVAATVRWFSERLSIDAGLAVNLAADSDVRSTGALSGEIDNLPVAPIVSAIWVW